MRISGGKAKGIKLRVPKGSLLRPAAEPVRERLFSSLGDLVKGTTFLDLFAGTGSYGLETLSRGAEKGAFIEHDAKTLSCLRQNLADVCKSAKVSLENFEVVSGDALRATPRQSGPFEIIFADPPYEQGLAENIFNYDIFKLLKTDGLIIIEHEERLDLSQLPNFVECRKYGHVSFSFFQKS